MSDCSHSVLVLCDNPAQSRIRCRRCHLTISREELGDEPCPECAEERGEAHFDFEALPDAEESKVRYRCEQCSLLIEV